MCTFSYPGEPNKDCPYPEFFRHIASPSLSAELSTQLDPPIYWDLPIDNEGRCIFHSEDLALKTSEKVISRFKSLVSVLNLLIGSETFSLFEVMDFKGFIFSEEWVQYTEDYGTHIIEFADLSFNHYCFFDHSVFKQRTLFDYCKFPYTVYFNHAQFDDIAEFKYAQIGMRAHFNNAKMNGGISINNTEVNSLIWENAFINGGQIMESPIRNSFNSKQVHLKNFLFKDVNFLIKETSIATDFSASRFENVQFESCAFHSQCLFQESSFDQVTFVDTQFSDSHTVSFDHISVHNKLIIKSTNPSDKTFRHRVDMNLLPHHIQGQILFEQANVYLIDPQEVLKELSRPGTDKIYIGDGCDRYRMKKEIQLTYNESNRHLFEELSQAFVHFYEWDDPNGLAVKVECEYFKSFVLIRFFSDRNLQDHVFHSLLAEKVPSFLSLLRNPKEYLQNTLREGNKIPTDSEKIETLDLLRKAIAFNIGILARIQSDEHWQKKETLDLLAALPMDKTELNIHIEKLELHKHYQQQKSLLNFGNNYLAGNNLQVSSDD